MEQTRKKDYQTLLDSMEKVIHRELCKKLKFDRTPPPPQIIYAQTRIHLGECDVKIL